MRRLIVQRALRGLAVLAALVATSPAAAQRTSLHGTGSFTVAYNDNILSTPDDPDPNAAGVVTEPIADLALTVSPGLLWLFATERTELTVSYQRSFVFFAFHGDASSAADFGQVGLLHRLSPIEQVGVSFNVNRSATNLAGLQSPLETSTTAVPQSPAQLLSFQLAETYQRGLTERWSVNQAANASVTTSLGGAGSVADLYVLRALAGPALQLERHLFVFEAGAQYNFIDVPQPDPTVEVTDRHQAIPIADVTWGWQLAERWRSQLVAGVAFPFDTQGTFAVAPTGAAGVYYVNLAYGASLVASRAITPNFATQQVLYADALALSGNVALWEAQGLVLQGSLGLGQNRALDTSQVITGPVLSNNFTFDASLGWTPRNSPLNLALRCQRLQQFGSSEDSVLQDFQRNVVGFTLGFILPPRGVDDQERAFRPRGLRTEPQVQAPSASR